MTPITYSATVGERGVNREDLTVIAIILEQDVRILESLEFHLSKLQFEVTAASSVEAAVSLARRLKPELIIIGIDSSPTDAVRQCKILQSVCDDPILVAIGSQDAFDTDPRLRTAVDHAIVGGLKIAPFLRELRRIAWRRKGVLCPAQAPTVERDGFVVAPSEGVVRIGNRTVSVSTHEADLMYCLVTHAPGAVPRETLLNLVWGVSSATASDRRVEACIYTLRRKIEPNPAQPVHLVLRRGAGYVLVTDATLPRMQSFAPEMITALCGALFGFLAPIQDVLLAASLAASGA
ncbi:MAG TPA: response regulator transcription factor [Capsulimonadaceae bacterium]|jgi:DNA-binding response OmpR family regulator